MEITKVCYLVSFLGLIIISFAIADSLPGNSIVTSERSQISSINPTFEPFEWNVSTPEAQGLDSNILADIFQDAESLSGLHSILIIRNGYLIAEQYFNGYDKNKIQLITSASKSFLSALVGIALREGYLTSLNQKMMDFFPEYDSPELNSRMYDITIEHLLTMKGGGNYFQRLYII